MKDWLAMYRARDRAFGEMPEPQWRMLIDLFVNGPASVSSLCIASGAPMTTALRHIGEMESASMILRTDDPLDRRRHFLRLTDNSRAILASLEHKEAT